jgi:hypothetical protein
MMLREVVAEQRFAAISGGMRSGLTLLSGPANCPPPTYF